MQDSFRYNLFVFFKNEFCNQNFEYCKTAFILASYR